MNERPLATKVCERLAALINVAIIIIITTIIVVVVIVSVHAKFGVDSASL